MPCRQDLPRACRYLYLAVDFLRLKAECNPAARPYAKRRRRGDRGSLSTTTTASSSASRSATTPSRSARPRGSPRGEYKALTMRLVQEALLRSVLGWGYKLRKRNPPAFVSRLRGKDLFDSVLPTPHPPPMRREPGGEHLHDQRMLRPIGMHSRTEELLDECVRSCGDRRRHIASRKSSIFCRITAAGSSPAS
jgi:hypothetical protein